MRARAATVSVLVALAVAGAAHAHGGGDANYSSQIKAVSPSGVEASILDFDDRIRVRNTGDRRLVVEGYNDEPYVRIDPDGTVFLNRRSPAYYLNDDRFANVKVPASAHENAPPQWRQVDRSGSYEWHDHRIHWMSKGTVPKAVKDESVRTRVFDWRVPLAAGATRGAVSGTLDWVPAPDEGPPTALFVVLAAAVLGGAGLVVAVRRRRRTGAPLEENEAW